MRSLLLALAAVLIAAPAAHARDATVTSFDGTQIVLSFHPAPGGGKAPTILSGHGWAGSRQTDPNAASDETTGNVGVGALRKAGFNVLTWDARGFGDSGGTVTVDSPDAEGRDVSALIDWLAQQPEAQLDKAGDPRVGMTGVSYAGGIELVTAARDKRIDAIAPIIAWHSLHDLALQGGDGQGRLVLGALRRGRADVQGPARPAHHVRVRERHVHRQAVRR